MKTESLAEQIDALVRTHLAQVEAEATNALRRAFATTTGTRTRRARRAPSKQRPLEEVTALAEQLHARIMAEPGELMSTHARALGASVRDLHRPMTLLRRAGRLRTTGARNNTRYYPMPGA